jgi:HSP20 family molecular chaperone IbpA
MKNIQVHTVESISEQLQQILDRIRVRAYEHFSNRGSEPNRDLEDWLAAERELVSPLTATFSEEGNEIVADIQTQEIDPATLNIQVTSREAFILAGLKTADVPGSNDRVAFGVVAFPHTIDAAGVRAEYARGLLRLRAPISETARTFEKSA